MDSEGKETTNEDKKEREKNKKRKHKNLSGSVIYLHPKTMRERKFHYIIGRLQQCIRTFSDNPNPEYI